MLLKHAAKHLFNGGIGLRHLCDWVLFIKQYPDLNYVYITKELRKDGMERFARVFTVLGLEYIGADLVDLPASWSLDFKDKLIKNVLWAKILESGNFGQRKRRVQHFSIWNKSTNPFFQVLKQVWRHIERLEYILILSPLFTLQLKKKLKERFLH